MANAKYGITKILSKFNDDDLFSLAATVTQGLLKNKINSREEAINAIIKYSPDEISILRRKLLTREILFSYLHDNEIRVTLPITKNELIDKIAQFWQISNTSSQYEFEDYPNGHSVENEVQNNKLIVKNSINNSEVAAQTSSDHTISTLAEQFATWFYSMLNSNEPVGWEHFFSDSKLKINLTGSNASDTIIVDSGPEDIATALFQQKMQHNLFFNPNISKDGIQGRMDPHGLVLVLACGTLHTNNTCVGVFEQVFALARDPFCDNNWKIKNTELTLRSRSEVTGPPSLCESELTNNLLSLPSE